MSVRPSTALCSDNSANTETCANAIAQWKNAAWRSDQAGAMLQLNWENSSCLSLLKDVVCSQGTVPRLGVNATTVEHVQATVRFASTRNLRLVIKNTGNDYMGRSTAADSLLLWLHHMKNMEVLEEYTSCTGERVSNAIRLGAGVQWGELYTWLSSRNLIAVGAISRTVGAIGGYLQGGGHSPLSRWKGMAADQVLQLDVVTADGRFQTVNACHNEDLFWALRGGGGGSFAVVVSAVLRTFPSPPVISAYYVISAPNETRYSHFIRDFIRLMSTLADADYAGYFHMVDTNITIGFFVPNGDLTSVTTLFNDLMKNNSDLEFSPDGTQSFRSFYDYYVQRKSSKNFFGDNAIVGSRLIPEKVVRNQPDQLADVLVRIRGRSENQTVLAGHLVAGGHVSNTSVNTSVNPAWRTALLNVFYTQGWLSGPTAVNQELLASHLRAHIEILQTIAGGANSSCYMNEADLNEPNWQQTYFGTQNNYDRLKSIKNSVDPHGLFICKNCVGSDEWSADLNCPKKSHVGRFHVKISLLVLILVFHIST